MTDKIQTQLEKKIKRSLYGTPQTVLGIFPPGFGSTALQEVQSILSNLWFPQKLPGEITLLDNEIRIANIHLFAMTELLIRSQCLSDLRLVIAQEKAYGKSVFEKKCRAIPWEFFLNRQMTLKIKVDSVASHAFHETGLKEIMNGIVKDYVLEVVKGDDTQGTTTLYVNLYKNKLTISISLAGEPLYKRGFRNTLSASAPLREDAAACCIYKALEFAGKIQKNYNDYKDYKVSTLLLPFSGTGTFAFEYFQYYYQFVPGLLQREYSLQKMPLFRPENFNFLIKKARAHCLLPLILSENDKHSEASPLQCICIDSSDNANAALQTNIEKFKSHVIKNGFLFPADLFFSQTESKQPFYLDDFLKMNLHTLINTQSHIFIPLNPPYGIRLGKNSTTVTLYKKIAHQLREISRIIKGAQKNMLGFILCPNVESWSAFCKELGDFQTETYHFTQGGLDIRVCQFFI